MSWLSVLLIWPYFRVAGFFDRKVDSDGNIIRYKARLVARGDRQREFIHYNDTYSPVARMKSIRVLLALAAKMKMPIHQMDVKTAFLNADMDRDLFMKPPPNFQLPPGKDDYVWKLKKSLYGLKQASRLWGDHLANTLSSLGFVRSSADNCIWTRQRNGHYTYIGCYVDDLLIMGTAQDQVDQVKASLSSTYTMKDLGLMKWCLGMRVTQSPNGDISLDQSLAIKDLCQTYGISSNTSHRPYDKLPELSTVHISLLMTVRKLNKIVFSCLINLIEVL